MSIFDKRIYSEELKGYVEECKSCKESAKMHSTGYAYKERDSENYWCIEFRCEKCHENNILWNQEYQKKIEQVLMKNKSTVEDGSW